MGFSSSSADSAPAKPRICRISVVNFTGTQVVSCFTRKVSGQCLARIEDARGCGPTDRSRLACAVTARAAQISHQELEELVADVMREMGQGSAEKTQENQK